MSTILAAFLAIVLFADLAAGRALAQEAPLAPARLRVEYRVDPVGIDERRPRFSWEVADPRRGAVQSAYEIVVTETAAEGKVVWETGKVDSRETCQVEYAGPALASFRPYAWKVRSFDGAGRASPWSPTAFFGTGALDPSDWKAQWIGDATPVPPSVPARNGYHSQFAEKEDVQKWIQLEVPPGQSFDSLYLYPARPYDAADQPGFLFPKRVKVWMCDDPSFESKFIRIFDEYRQDIPNPGTEPFVLRTKTTSYTVRHVRIGVTKMAGIEGKGFAFALAEAELRKGGQIVSRGAAASASDSIETGAWSMANLTDGDLASHAASGYGALPPPLLRKEFSLAAPAEGATLFASALGLFEVKINGKRVGEDQLAPGWTDYGLRVPYIAYDVSGHLQPGKNVITAQLADGWYAGRIGLSSVVPGGPPRALYGRKPRFFAQLEVRGEKPETIVTDSSWRSTIAGPLREADLLDGEIYDARREIEGVDLPGFDDSSWPGVEVAVDVRPRLEALACEPARVRIVEVLHPVGLKEPKAGIYVFDLGQNMVGWCRMLIHAPAGTEITFRHAEVVETDGSIYTGNLRTASQTDRYVCNGTSSDVLFEPRFTCHGFRYVEVSGLPKPPDVTHLKGYVVTNSAREVGTFRASDPLLERLWSNIRWTLRGNFLSVPTDCPQRDERLGWMGDIAAFAQTAAFQTDVAGFYSKWLRDVRDAQADDGRFPDFAPHPYDKNARFTGTPAWGDAGVIVPWTAWLNYGDRRLVAEHLDSMLRWLEWIRSKNPDLVWRKDRGNDYGDWLNGDTLVRDGWPKTGASTPGEVLATAYFARSADLVGKMARAVDRQEDAKKCEELGAGIRAAFRKAFVAEDGRVQGDSQGAYALAMDFDLLDDAEKARATARLAENIEKNYGGHLSTGFASTLPAMMALSEHGQIELATKLALDHRFPSWGYAIDNGATTLWERWDGFVPERGFQDAGMNSFNHFAFGAVGEWMMRVLAGIEPDPKHPGWSRFTIHPRAGDALTSVAGQHDTIRGRILSSWWRSTDGAFHLEVTIPANTSARVVLPAKGFSGLSEGGKPIEAGAPHVRVVEVKDGEAILDVAAGHYVFQSKVGPK